MVALTTLMSVGLLGHGGQLSPLTAASLAASSQRLALSGEDEEASSWMASLAQAAREMQGGAKLPDHLTHALSLATSHLVDQPQPCLNQPVDAAFAPTGSAVLLPHLINLPPPACV